MFIINSVQEKINTGPIATEDKGVYFSHVMVLEPFTFYSILFSEKVLYTFFLDVLHCCMQLSIVFWDNMSVNILTETQFCQKEISKLKYAMEWTSVLSATPDQCSINSMYI